MRRLIALALGSFCSLWGQAGPYERQKVDVTAADRGKRVYTQYCINCHGALAKGTDQGPDLIRSPLVLRDRLGDQIAPALKKLANHKGDLTQAQVESILKSTALPLATSGSREIFDFDHAATITWDTDCDGTACDAVGAGVLRADAALTATPAP